MIAYINNDPLEVLFALLFAILAGTIIVIWRKEPQKIYFALVFYIPLSLKSSFGSLSIYLFISFYLLVLLFYPSSIRKNSVHPIEFLVLLLVVFSVSLSLITTPNFFFKDAGKLRISKDLLSIIIMISNVAIYHLSKIFLRTKFDFITFFKVTVLGGGIASLAGYMQAFEYENNPFFKYIAFSQNTKWGSTRVAATMQGYEFLAEYTVILIGFCTILFLVERKRFTRLIYALSIINFILLLTLTQVRGIYVAFALALLYLIILLFFNGKFGTMMKVAFFSCLTFILLLSSILIIDQFRPDTRFIDRIVKLQNIDVKEGSLDTRSGVWDYGLQVFQSMSLSEKFIGSGHKHLAPDKQNRGKWPHCLYLSYPIRDGVIGFFFFLLFLLIVYKNSLVGVIRSYKLVDKNLYMIALILHLLFVIILIDELKIEFIRLGRSQNIVWLFWGTIMAYSSYLKNEITNRLSI